MKNQKIALVLSGGGFNGAFQLGALNYINRNWKSITGKSTPLKFDLIAGVSTGALNGALLAMNKLELLNDLWMNRIAKNGVSEIYISDILSTEKENEKVKLKVNFKELTKRIMPELKINLGLFKKIRLLLSKRSRVKYQKELIKSIQKGIKANFKKIKAIADNTPLRRKLEKYVSIDEMKTKFFCGFVSLDDGNYHSVESNDFNSNQDLINGILASTSIPIVWEPIEKIQFKERNHSVVSRNNIDGGIRNSSPLADVMKWVNAANDEYKIIVINCNSGKVKQENFSNQSIGAIASRSLYNIMMTEIFNNDLEHIIKMNQMIHSFEQNSDGQKMYGLGGKLMKSFDIKVINPDHEFDLGDPLSATERLIQSRLNHGEVMAERTFKTFQR